MALVSEARDALLGMLEQAAVPVRVWPHGLPDDPSALRAQDGSLTAAWVAEMQARAEWRTMPLGKTIQATLTLVVQSIADGAREAEARCEMVTTEIALILAKGGVGDWLVSSWEVTRELGVFQTSWACQDRVMIEMEAHE